MNRLFKLGGKLVTYLGFIASIWGIVNNEPVSIMIGVIAVIFGCMVHEVSEDG